MRSNLTREILYNGLFVFINILLMIFLQFFIKNICLATIFQPDVKNLYEMLYRESGTADVRATAYKHRVIDFENSLIRTLMIHEDGTVSTATDDEPDVPYAIACDSVKYFTTNNSAGMAEIRDFEPEREIRRLDLDIFSKYSLEVVNNEKLRLSDRENRTRYVDIKLTPGYQVEQAIDNKVITVNRRSPCNTRETACRVRYGDYVTFYARHINPEIEVPEWGSDLYDEKARNLRWICANDQDLRPKLRQCQIDQIEIENTNKRYTC